MVFDASNHVFVSPLIKIDRSLDIVHVSVFTGTLKLLKWNVIWGQISKCKLIWSPVKLPRKAFALWFDGINWRCLPTTVAEFQVDLTNFLKSNLWTVWCDGTKEYDTVKRLSLCGWRFVRRYIYIFSLRVKFPKGTCSDKTKTGPWISNQATSFQLTGSKMFGVIMKY